MTKDETTLKGFALRRTLSGLKTLVVAYPQGSRSSNPELQLANAFGVFSN
jgi:hypothetical protein